MDSKITNQYEYQYQSANQSHHHLYLIKPLMQMISEYSHRIENQQKLRILDIGCGNGNK